MKIDLLEVPYDSGHRNLRMGSGPEHFLKNGLQSSLEKEGHQVSLKQIESASGFRSEISTAFELNRILAKRVRSAVEQNHFPLVLAGNCNCAVGILAGLDSDNVGLIWYDAHGDFNTPETTRSGFLDGMALAMVTGRCWSHLAASVSNFRPLPEDKVLLVGARDFDPEEGELLKHSEIHHIPSSSVNNKDFEERLQSSLLALQKKVQNVYVHIDLDVLDPQEAPANQFGASGGLSVEQAESSIRLICRHLPLRALSVAAYDPEYDPEHSCLKAGFRLIHTALHQTESPNV
jgi:arginase